MTETDQPREVVTEAPTGLPVLPPLAALIEIVVLVVVPGALDYFVPGFPSLNESQPHFYWLPVLLLTLQYGSGSGLLAAGMAIVFSSVLGWPEQEIGENHFSYLLRIWLQPVLWIATSVILGQLRLRQIERKQALGRSVARLTQQRAELAEHTHRLRERCDRLERAIATRHEGDASALMAALGKTQSGDEAEAAEALHDVIAIAFGDSRLSVLTLRDGCLHTTFRHPRGSEHRAEPILPESAFVRAVVRDGQSLSVLHAAGESDLEGRGLAAVPIARGTQVVGAVLLEGCHPELLDASVTDRLATIALAAGGVRQGDDLSLTETSEAATAGQVDDDVPGLSRLPRWRRTRRRPSRLAAISIRSGRRA